MVKKKSHKNNNHISSKVGFSILALVVLVVSAIVVTQYNTNNQVQTDQSQAASVNNVSPTPCPWQYVCVQVAHKVCQAYAERQVCSK